MRPHFNKQAGCGSPHLLIPAVQEVLGMRIVDSPDKNTIFYLKNNESKKVWLKW
jgi:hypothetical protein